MAFKTAIGAITLPASVAANGDISYGAAMPGAATHYLVVGASCFDQNGIHRVLSCNTDGYVNYISNVSGAEAVNGHIRLLAYQLPIDEYSLLKVTDTYNFTRLTGFGASATSVYLSIVCYA